MQRLTSQGVITFSKVWRSAQVNWRVPLVQSVAAEI